MNFTKDKPTEIGFYWCRPVFGRVVYLDCDESIIQGNISVAEVVELKRASMGSNIHVRFIGHKIPHSIRSPVIQNALWGSKIDGPVEKVVPVKKEKGLKTLKTKCENC